ncbi:single-stranded DNA-binding protein [Lysobacter sp. FW306-1B-D06B]|uniref:single-stranded DNA-binding protein n=1 Tax=Lysobacter sp. FW306-1B-D06B TaxID=3140250 RepID=UPI0031407690
MRIEIKSGTSTNHRQGNNGKTYGEQQAALHTPGSDFPIPFKVNCEVGFEKKPGFYRFGPGSFGTDKFGNLVIGRVALEPEVAASTTKAA